MYYIRYFDDDDDDKIVYHKILNDFDRMVSVRNNIVNLINNDNYKDSR